MPAKTGETDRPLSVLINTATRSVHTKLNKLVVSRLSLALPPKAEDASNYVSGLLHITPIYIAFESIWSKILQSRVTVEEEDDPDNADSSDICDPETAQSGPADLQTLRDILRIPHPITVHPRTRSLLTNLHLPGLARSRELQKDIVSLTGWSNRTVTEHLEDAAESPTLSEFLHHINQATETRPHVLTAYAWVLYMALFSGGRIIRSTLQSVPPDFWVPASAAHHQSASRTGPGVAAAAAGGGPLHFFSFASTPDDGEELKTTFKQRLVESEALLTGAEREDVVQEARNIFGFMVRLVTELDNVCDTEESDASHMVSLRSRDSVVIEKERRALARLARKVAEEAKRDAGR
ncbi:hypothetical protein DL764_006286 [Monosporascus ibericus]|uniref:Heme oxygenase-like protein n=1 Tax=Monosporascus ibericus TaxID=155417 RepID=A0A4Q4T7M6_9PEZI|nr:hypothetical protein DL764_006286 [Monosporascus ibericus]